MKFDPDKPSTKHRSMTGNVHYQQDGHKFNAGYEHIGKLKGGEKAAVEPPAEAKKLSVRERAAAKIAQKKGGLEGFKAKEAPDAVDSMLAENAASKKAEELVE